MTTLNPLHARFLLLLPRIEAHAKIYFRDIRCAAQRADNVAETIALAWQWFVRIDERGKDAADFVTITWSSDYPTTARSAAIR